MNRLFTAPIDSIALTDAQTFIAEGLREFVRITTKVYGHLARLPALEGRPAAVQRGRVQVEAESALAVLGTQKFVHPWSKTFA